MSNNTDTKIGGKPPKGKAKSYSTSTSTSTSTSASASASSRASAILRASLARRTDGPITRHAAAAPADNLPLHREEGNLLNDSLESNNEEHEPLADSLHGPSGVESTRFARRFRAGSTSSVHDGHGDIADHYHSSLAHRQAAAGLSAAAISRSAHGSVGSLPDPRFPPSSTRPLSPLAGAANLVRQISNVGMKDVELNLSGEVPLSSDSSAVTTPVGNTSGKGKSLGYKSKKGSSSPLSPNTVATHHSDEDSIEHDGHRHHHHHHHHHHDSCAIRLFHSRWMQLTLCVGVLGLIGIGVGVAMSSNRNGNGETNAIEETMMEREREYEEWLSEHPDGEAVVEIEPDVFGEPAEWEDEAQDAGEEVGKDNADRNEPMDAEEEVPPTTTTTTTTVYSPEVPSPTPPQVQISPEQLEQAVWEDGPTMSDPMLQTVGSDLSFSADGSVLAVSSGSSRQVQVVAEIEDGSWVQLGESLPGTSAALSGNGRRLAVADWTESVVTTYVMERNQWTIYGTRIIDLFGAQSVSLNYDGTTLAVSHHPDQICRICPSVATIFELRTDGEEWLQEADVLAAYDFDFAVELSDNGMTLGFSGRIYENQGAGLWSIKSNFPDFISSHTSLSRDGRTAAISLPDCHLFKDTDPNVQGCTNTEPYEVNVMEFVESNAADGTGYWNRKGVSLGPEVSGSAGTTDLSISDDGNTIAIAVGGRGHGGEVGLNGNGDAAGTEGAALPPLRYRRRHQRRRALSNTSSGAVVQSRQDHLRRQDHQHRRLQGKGNGDNWSEDWTKYDAYATDEAYVRVYRYDDRTGSWYPVGTDIALNVSGATVNLSRDGTRLAVGVPYGGDDERGFVKMYDLEL